MPGQGQGLWGRHSSPPGGGSGRARGPGRGPHLGPRGLVRRLPFVLLLALGVRARVAVSPVHVYDSAGTTAWGGTLGGKLANSSLGNDTLLQQPSNHTAHVRTSTVTGKTTSPTILFDRETFSGVVGWWAMAMAARLFAGDRRNSIVNTP